jgi:hypothetical protein
LNSRLCNTALINLWISIWYRQSFQVTHLNHLPKKWIVHHSNWGAGFQYHSMSGHNKIK